MKPKLTHHIQESLKKSYGAIASEFDQTRKVPWQEFNHFLAYTKHGGNAIDLGCGTGRLYEFLKQKKVNYWGVDHNEPLLEQAKKNYPEAHFELTDISDPHLPEEEFDNAYCIAAFHHIPGKDLRKKTVDHFYDLLKPDGVLVLTVWNLFQWKYAKVFLKAIFSFFLHFGFKYAWNDLWIKWGSYPLKRYYHAFTPKEFLSYFQDERWGIEDFYFTRKGKKVSFWRSFNFILIVRKK